MSELLIKGMDEQVVKRLENKALRQGKSLEDYAKEVLVSQVEPVRQMSKEEFIIFAKEMREKNGPQKTDTTLLIREDRDTR